MTVEKQPEKPWDRLWLQSTKMPSAFCAKGATGLIFKKIRAGLDKSLFQLFSVV